MPDHTTNSAFYDRISPAYDLIADASEGAYRRQGIDAMQLEPGDLQFVYNHGLLHDRTGFEDWPAPEDRRHLLRLWLSIPGDRPLAAVFNERYGSIEPGARGGVAMEDITPVAPLEPA